MSCEVNTKNLLGCSPTWNDRFTCVFSINLCGLFSKLVVRRHLVGILVNHIYLRMAHHCCVPGCTQNSGFLVKCTPVLFHSFPKDKLLRKDWIAKNWRDVGQHFDISSTTKVYSIRYELVFHPKIADVVTIRNWQPSLKGICRKVLFQRNFFWTKTPWKRDPLKDRQPLLPSKRVRQMHVSLGTHWTSISEGIQTTKSTHLKLVTSNWNWIW